MVYMACRIKLHYSHGLAGVDFEGKEARFTVDGHEKAVVYDLLVGCDGRNSVVRSALEEHDPDMWHEEHVAPRWYKGFHRLPPTGKSSPCDLATKAMMGTSKAGTH